MTYILTIDPDGLSGTTVTLTRNTCGYDQYQPLATLFTQTIADGDAELVADAVCEASTAIVKEIL